MMDRLVTDDIPNIRFNVAKSYAVLISTLKRLPENGTLADVEKSGNTLSPSPKGQELIESRILPKLQILEQDDDVDVRFFAVTAAKVISDQMETA